MIRNGRQVHERADPDANVHVVGSTTYTKAWSGFTPGDQVLVNIEGRPQLRGYTFVYMQHVKSESSEWLDVKATKKGRGKSGPVIKNLALAIDKVSRA